jgi:hypothetical protein
MKRSLLAAPLLLVPLLLASCATRDVTDTSGGTIDEPTAAGGAAGAGQAGAAGTAGGQGGTGGAATGGTGGTDAAGGKNQGGSGPAGSSGAAGADPAGGPGGSNPFGGGGAGSGQGGGSPFGGGGTAGKGGAGASNGGTSGVSGKGGTAGSGNAGSGNAGSGNAGSGQGGQGGSGQGGMSGGAGGSTGALCTYAGTGLDDPCYTCWNQAQTGGCAKEHDACAGDAECHALMVCWDQCKSDDDHCTKSCSADHPDGASAFQLFQSCICGAVCQTECQDQCSGISSLNRCKHDVCTSGFDLDPDCSPCAKTICDEDPTCCDFGWDNSCVTKAESMCGCPPPEACLHSECATGAPLDPACSPCAKAVCDTYPLCCDAFGKWDLACANAVASLCSP